MTVGHMFVGGGEAPEPKKVKAAYSAPTTAWRTAAIASPKFTMAKIGIPAAKPR